MRIASFNMRSGGSIQHWSEILAVAEPDILLVQETKDPSSVADAPISSTDIADAAWAAVHHGRWGSAVWFRESSLTPVPIPGFAGWVVGGEVETDSSTIYVYSVHLPPERGSYIKSANLMLDALEPLVAGAPVILGGDWNLTVGVRQPGEPRGNRPGELELFDRLENDFGVRSAWRVAHPEGPLPQTLRWVRNPETPYHCDGIFLPTALTSRVREASVLAGSPWLELSDHNPVVVDWESTVVFDH